MRLTSIVSGGSSLLAGGMALFLVSAAPAMALDAGGSAGARGSADAGANTNLGGNVFSEGMRRRGGERGASGSANLGADANANTNNGSVSESAGARGNTGVTSRLDTYLDRRNNQ